MNCKYPKGSSCIECSSKYICEDSTFEYAVEVKPPKNVLLSASQANQMTKENIGNIYTEEMKNVIEMINDAISDCRFGVSGSWVLEPKTVEKLKKLGYRVETGYIKTSYDPEETPFCNIYWK